ncbi:MAG: HIT domain-containing protein [Chloroflexi bacterium]|nr:HIT domain-containing protein [Chloroflexota bacterium]
MERLWTPWRSAFVEGASDNGAVECFLCAKPAQHADRANLILLRAKQVYALLNLYPYNSGHLMIAPYVHAADLGTLDPSIAEEMMRMTQRCVEALQQAYRPDGFNVGMNLGKSAGAGVPGHLHMHVVPRWAGDTNFMPIVGETKVLPESLDQTYDRLEPVLARS